jgi:glycosyltransferase involved in cell wall biosynthesis
MAPLIRNRFGISAVLIPNGVNTELFHPTFEDVRTRVRTDLGVRQDEFCLCYLGSIENWLDLESVVHALTQLKSMRLIMIGGPPRAALYLQSILTLCEKEGVRVTSTGFKSQAEAAKILSACDAAIIPFPLDRELSAVSLPDKTFEYLASGIPVISTKLPDVQKLFGDLVHFYSSTDELIEVLRRLQSHMNDEKCDPSEQIARAKNYDWKTISRSYENLISELVPVGAGSCPSQGGNQQSSATRIKLDRTSRRIARQDENSSCVSF